jgi:hypothetical protein
VRCNFADADSRQLDEKTSAHAVHLLLGDQGLPSSGVQCSRDGTWTLSFSGAGAFPLQEKPVTGDLASSFLGPAGVDTMSLTISSFAIAAIAEAADAADVLTRRSCSCLSSFSLMMRSIMRRLIFELDDACISAPQTVGPRIIT